MAKFKPNDVPPGGEDRGIFQAGSEMGPAPVSTSTTGFDPAPIAPGSPQPADPAQGQPKTTRGMNRVLKAADAVWKELKDLEPAERGWVWSFTLTQFPELKEPK